ncbi:MAG TPA: type II secretion system protein [Candidatus Saccharimonadales bacterium]|nr:type II secretion system protein [Candidatus Saccharimonadales bacterium]
MNMPVKNNRGFTIIEVVLVLAIAGLIFLVVFLALPALQRGQRDTQRKNDAGRMVSQLVAYQTNNQGKLPETAGEISTFVSGYMTSGSQSFDDPSTGDPYTINGGSAVITTAPATQPTTAAGTIFYYINSKCSGSSVVANTGTRNYAVVVYQEQGGAYCQGS